MQLCDGGVYVIVHLHIPSTADMMLLSQNVNCFNVREVLAASDASLNSVDMVLSNRSVAIEVRRNRHTWSG